MQEFLDKVKAAIVDSIVAESQNGSPEEQVLGKVLPRLGFELIKHPGCLYLSYEEDNVITGDTPPAMLTSVAQGMRFALVINGGKQADKIAADFLELTHLLPDGGAVKHSTASNFPYESPAFPSGPPPQNLIILAAGDGALDAAIAGLDGKSNGLADAERFKTGVQRSQL